MTLAKFSLRRISTTFAGWLTSEGSRINRSGFVPRMNRASNGLNANARVQQAQPPPNSSTAIPSRLASTRAWSIETVPNSLIRMDQFSPAGRCRINFVMAVVFPDPRKPTIKLVGIRSPFFHATFSPVSLALQQRRLSSLFTNVRRFWLLTKSRARYLDKKLT